MTGLPHSEFKCVTPVQHEKDNIHRKRNTRANLTRRTIMGITQISISLNNLPGALSEIARLLGYSGINIRGVSVVEGKKTSILRLIVSDYFRAERILKENGIDFKEETVLAVEISNNAGALSKCAKALSDGGVNVNYIYSFYPFASSEKNAHLILKTDSIEEAEKAFAHSDVKIITEKEIYRLE
jgi:hypothetical protein